MNWLDHINVDSYMSIYLNQTSLTDVNILIKNIFKQASHALDFSVVWPGAALLRRAIVDNFVQCNHDGGPHH